MINIDYDALLESHPKLAARKVWCRKCRREESMEGRNGLRDGWPMCCSQTMTIDPPEEWNRP